MRFNDTIINPSNTWQIGTGDDTRMYYDIFLRFGVALVGPGDPGIEGEEKTLKYYDQNPHRSNWGKILKQVKTGDWVIARKGKSWILGIGRVIDTYNYSQLFSDVEGWDLQHFVKVKWYVPKAPNKRLELGGYWLTQRTLQGCNSQKVYSAIYKYEFEEQPPENTLEGIVEEKLEINDIVDSLIEKGIRVQDAENIGLTLQRIIRLTHYYINYNGSVSEAEIISFLIAPTLIALGWSEQKIKFQLSNVDISIFKEAYDEGIPQEPEIIIEAKKFYNGLAFTSEQIKTYSNYFPKCHKFIVTNGYRYKYFEKVNDELICKGYFNLLDLKAHEYLRKYEKSAIESMLAISNF